MREWIDYIRNSTNGRPADGQRFELEDVKGKFYVGRYGGVNFLYCAFTDCAHPPREEDFRRWRPLQE